MSGQNGVQRKKTVDLVETGPALAGAVGHATPLDDKSCPSSPPAPANGNIRRPDPCQSTESQGFWQDIKSMRWVVVPSSLLKLLLIPLTFWANWELFVPYLAPNASNPFSPLLFISHRISDSSPQDPRYQKGWLDLLFIAYYIIFWSFVRQTITVHLLKPLGKWFGLTKEAKIDRFAEQGYAAMYFAVMASWGLRIMSQLPTWWYQTEHFWIDYPHWEMIPELKTYYLMQSAYWCQQFIVMVLGLEKPRKDYHILVAHHAVTLYLIGGSYLTNMTYELRLNQKSTIANKLIIPALAALELYPI